MKQLNEINEFMTHESVVLIKHLLGLNFLGRYLYTKTQARQLPYFWTQLNISMLAH